MIECTECGFVNDDEDNFCGGCREPLAWTGKQVETPLAEPDAEVQEAPEEDRGIVERVVERLTGSEAQQDAVATDTPATTEVPATGKAAATDDTAAALAAEAVARAEQEAEQAEQLQREAEERARQQAEATERARQHAEQAETARREAEEHARTEAEAAERIRAQLEMARTDRQEAEAQLRQETEAIGQAQAEARLQAEREAMEQVQSELEQAEAARKAAEARAVAERQAAEDAARAAAESEEARRAAEEQAREDARAAEQARRAAALVARPKPPAPSDTPPAEETGEPAAPTRRPRRSTRPRREKPAPRRDVPPTEDGGPRTPGPVLPDRARAPATPTPARTEVKRRLRPGDLVCGNCGEGNTPTRNFCRRCGNTLAEAEVIRRPWWKRWIPRRRPKTHEAGTRPRRGGGGGVSGARQKLQNLRRKVLGPIGKVGRIVGMIGIAAAAVGLTFNPGLRGQVMGPVGDAFERVKNIVIPAYDPVTPVAAEASSARADLDNGLCCAADNVLRFGNTWWHASEGGVGQSLTITLDSPTSIAKIGIIPGAGDDEIWADHPRPRDLEVDFLTTDGRTVTTLTLSDIRDEHDNDSQLFDVEGATEVATIRVTVTRVYGEGLESDDVAISEIRLLTRR